MKKCTHKNKNAQMKIQQTMFMLIVITLFFILIGMFLLVIKFSDIKKTATEQCEKNAQLLVSKISNTPEFSCGESFGTLKVNCIDSDKVMALKRSISNYKDFWGVSNIKIRKIYPIQADKICSESNYPDCNLIELRLNNTEGTYISNFVSLCRKKSYQDIFYDKCELAKVMISYEYNKKC